MPIEHGHYWIYQRLSDHFQVRHGEPKECDCGRNHEKIRCGCGRPLPDRFKAILRVVDKLSAARVQKQLGSKSLHTTTRKPAWQIRLPFFLRPGVSSYPTPVPSENCDNSCLRLDVTVHNQAKDCDISYISFATWYTISRHHGFLEEKRVHCGDAAASDDQQGNRCRNAPFA